MANEPSVKPWVGLAQKLSQLASNSIKKVTKVKVITEKKKLFQVLQVAAVTGVMKVSVE